ncbi:response regulator [Planctomycetota bacterium]
MKCQSARDKLINENNLEIIMERPRILVAEDEEVIRSMIEDYLGGQYEVIAFEDGVQAWEYAEKEHIDLLLTDFNMPRMNGLELALKIKHELPCPVPVIIQTSEYEEAQEMLLENIAEAYLAKPYKLKELKKVVASALGKNA